MTSIFILLSLRYCSGMSNTTTRSAELAPLLTVNTICVPDCTSVPCWMLWPMTVPSGLSLNSY